MVKGVAPDLLHVVPILDDSVLDRVVDGTDSTLLLGLVSDKDSFSISSASEHDILALRLGDD